MIYKHDKRSGLDRRSGNDRRSERSGRSFDMLLSQRRDVERRENNEIRTGWVKVSKFSSACLGVPVKKLK